MKSNGKFERLGKLLNTRENGYIYDLGTGKIFQLDEDEYKVLEYTFENKNLNLLSELKIKESDLLNTLKGLKNVIQKENLLKAPLVEFSSLHEEFDSIKSQIKNNGVNTKL